MTKRPLILIPALLAFAGAACSSAGEQVADQVRDEAAKELSISKDEVKTTCPDGADAKKGEKFTCDLVIDGEPVSADISFESDKKFTFEFTSQLFDKAELETEIGTQVVAGLAELGQPVDSAEADCGGGEKFVAIPKDDTIECDATASDGTAGTATVGLDESGAPTVTNLVPAS